ncbi:hypothetical protein KVV02_006539 [Mortierella alpina]|uniref:Uncharacterized protein n=1 Tax=Mortierella alpina TaxID=64518 RepID=A0A9P7ZYG5_MORAP|nr:hypothetical protein KVV02_006539 [Mortierella alpina]
MFYDLPSPDAPPNQAEMILTKYPTKRHLPLFGVSGCGKTRTAVDLLSRTWGLYFNAGAEDYGSGDMHSLDKDVLTYREDYMSEDMRRNTLRVQCLTYGLLYSRLLILEYCLSIAGKNTFSCQRWMLLQVATPAFQDIFQKLFRLINNLIHVRHQAGTSVNMAMAIITQQRFERVQGLIRSCSSPSTLHFKFLVILDESQVLGRLSSASFFDSDGTTVRPLLAPVLYAFRRLAGDASQDVCVMPCGTGLGSYDLTWAGGSASGGKLTRKEYHSSKLSGMVLDFAGWANEAAISSYLGRLCQGLDNEARRRLTQLIPPEAISRLFRDLRGRFRPIVSSIEDIIEEDDPMAWEGCILERVYRLTTADRPFTAIDKRRLEGNLCGELRRMFELVRHDSGSVAFAEFRNVEATLRLAVATFITQGGYMAFKGPLPELVEAAFGRIRLVRDGMYSTIDEPFATTIDEPFSTTIDEPFATTIDEPFAILAADNYFQSLDPDYTQHRHDQLVRAPTEQIRGKEWEFSIPFEMVHVFHKKTVSRRLFHDAEPPHSMFQHEADIVGWSGSMRTTGSQEMSTADFLIAHIKNNSERNQQAVPPFFYPEERLAGPDIVFVVRFSGLALDKSLDKAVDSSSTLSPGSASDDIICPVFVQLKLCAKLSESDVKKARGTVQPSKIESHGVKLSKYCQPHGHFISLIVSYPVELADYFIDTPLKSHKEGLKEITLTIDDSNIDDLFSEKHVRVIKSTKRLAVEMAATAKEVKLRRVAFDSPKIQNSVAV